MDFADRFPVINGDTQPVPPFGIMQVTGVQTSTGAFTVTRPTQDGLSNVLFNGSTALAAGALGSAHQRFPCIVAYQVDSQTGNSPAVGEIWGAAASSWYLTRAKPGFQILGGSGGGNTNIIPMPSSWNQWVKLTSTTIDATSGCYPATRYVRDVVAQTWTSAGTVWFFDPTTPTTATTSQYLNSVYLGYFDGREVWGANPAGGGASADTEMFIVTSECPDFDPSTGAVIGTKVQRQKVMFPSAWLLGSVECTTNRTDCCNDPGRVTVACCSNSVSKTLYLTFTGTGCAYLDGISIPITYCSTGILYAVEWTVKDYPLANGSKVSATLGCQIATFGGWVFSLQGTNGCALPVGGGCFDLHFGSAIGSTAILFNLGSTGDYTIISTSCDPLFLQATTNLKVTCCGSTFTTSGTITITE